MLREESADPEVVRQAKRIDEAADRCAAIVKTSFTMSHDETSETGLVDLNEVVETAVGMMRRGGVDDGVEIDCRLSETLPPVAADSDQAALVVVRLMQNAEAALLGAPKPGRIVVET